MKILKLRLRDAEAFEEAFDSDECGAFIFCPTTETLEPGTEVVVDLACKALPNRVMVKGHVESWRPALPRQRVRAGARVRFSDDEQGKVDFITETLTGARPPAPRRKHARLPVALPIQVCLQPGEKLAAELREISVSGALIAGIDQPPVGSELILSLTPPGGEEFMDISGRVIYHAGSDGTGIRFLFREGGGSRRLRELVRRLRDA